LVAPLGLIRAMQGLSAVAPTTAIDTHNKGVTTDFAGATVNFRFAQLLAEAVAPS
jgi:hypothetical protein